MAAAGGQGNGTGAGGRVDVRKTWKLFVNGAFERSESGRFVAARSRTGAFLANVCRGSRKDVKAAVRAAREGLASWSKKSAYNRGQILYRTAEVLESRRAEFTQELVRRGEATRAAATREVDAAIDRLVWYAGLSDKWLPILGSMNPVSGPWFNFSAVEPSGVIGVIAPDAQPLLGLVSLLAPVLCGGNAAVAVVAETAPLPALALGEVFASSDWPKGAVNLLSGLRSELAPALADHMDVDGLFGAAVGKEMEKDLGERAAQNVKRVRFVADADGQGPLWIEPFVEVKTIWHPIGV